MTTVKAPATIVTTGDLVVNLGTKLVTMNDIFVRLTDREYRTLELLNLRKGTTVTREMFFDHIYEGNEPGFKIIDVLICNLRRKLANASNGKNYIETVWGRGYVLREPT